MKKLFWIIPIIVLLFVVRSPAPSTVIFPGTGGSGGSVTINNIFTNLISGGGGTNITITTITNAFGVAVFNTNTSPFPAIITWNTISTSDLSGNFSIFRLYVDQDGDGVFEERGNVQRGNNSTVANLNQQFADTDTLKPGARFVFSNEGTATAQLVYSKLTFFAITGSSSGSPTTVTNVVQNTVTTVTLPPANAPYYFLYQTNLSANSQSVVIGTAGSNIVTAEYLFIGTIGGNYTLSNPVTGILLMSNLNSGRFVLTNPAAGIAYYQRAGSGGLGPIGGYTTVGLTGATGSAPNPSGTQGNLTNVSTNAVILGQLGVIGTNKLQVELSGSDGLANRTNKQPSQSITNAAALAVNGDVISIGNGTFTVTAAAIPYGVALQGSGRRNTTLFTGAGVTGTNLFLLGANAITDFSTTAQIAVTGTNCTLENIDIGPQNNFALDPEFGLALIGNVDGLVIWNSSLYVDGIGVNAMLATNSLIEFNNCKLWNDYLNDQNANGDFLQASIISGANTIHFNGGQITQGNPYGTNVVQSAMIIIGGTTGSYTNPEVDISGTYLKAYETQPGNTTPILYVWFTNAVHGVFTSTYPIPSNQITGALNVVYTNGFLRATN